MCRQLRMFFDSINIIEGSIERRSLTFYKRAKEDHAWVYRSIIQYLQKQKERYERKEIMFIPVYTIVLGI